MKNTSVKSAPAASKAKETKSKSDVAHGLRELFVYELKDIYWAEKTLTKAIPKMIKNATSTELVDALSDHLKETTEQVKRLEEVFSLIGEKAVAIKCEAMMGLIAEADEIMAGTEKGKVRDAGIILSAQKVEHYEIAAYGTLCSFAKTLNENEALALLEDTLDEEKGIDEKLTEIAESSINIDAAGEYEEDSDTMVATKTKAKRK
jgi:ferritin-like metal-binding protein YciE